MLIRNFFDFDFLADVWFLCIFLSLLLLFPFLWLGNRLRVFLAGSIRLLLHVLLLWDFAILFRIFLLRFGFFRVLLSAFLLILLLLFLIIGLLLLLFGRFGIFSQLFDGSLPILFGLLLHILLILVRLFINDCLRFFYSTLGGSLTSFLGSYLGYIFFGGIDDIIYNNVSFSNKRDKASSFLVLFDS